MTPAWVIVTGVEEGLVVHVAHRLARVKTRLESSRWLLYRGAWALDRAKEPFVTPAMVKLTVSETLALGRPLLLTRPIPGQETGNTHALVAAGAAFAAANNCPPMSTAYAHVHARPSLHYERRCPESTPLYQTIACAWPLFRARADLPATRND